MNKIKFWDQQILKWEYDQYQLINRFGLLSQAQKIETEALQLMNPILKGSSVVEYGCGTARLMPLLLKAGVSKYIGVDASTHAIQVAQNKVSSKDAHRVDLICAPIETLDPIPMDFSFSLSFLDWVEPNGLAKLNAPLFLHSFLQSYPQNSIFEIIKRSRYGEDFRPTCHSEEELTKAFHRARIKFYSSPKLGSIKLAHNLL